MPNPVGGLGPSVINLDPDLTHKLGVIGHQFGSGSGRDAATVAGAVIGSLPFLITVRRSVPVSLIERVRV